MSLAHLRARPGPGRDRSKTKVESRQMPPWFADPTHGAVRQRSLARAARHRDDREVGRRRGARRAIRRTRRRRSTGRPTAGRSSPTSSSTGPEFRVPAHTPQRRRRVGDVSRPERLHARTPGSPRSRSSRACSTVTHHICFTFQPHRPRREILRGELERSRRATTKARRSRRAAPNAAAAAGRPRPPTPGADSAAASTATCLGARPTTIVRSAPAS